MKINRRAASVIEYSLLVAVTVAAIIGIQIYLKRAISGNWRQAADTFGYGRQYDPKYDASYTGTKFNLWGN
jgi:Flp pilus assembly pilin Flp